MWLNTSVPDDTTPQGEQLWDTSADLMTRQQYLLTALITNCVLAPLLLLIGSPTNLVSSRVFYKQGLRDRMNLCLFVLALVDTMFLVSSFVVGFNSYIGLWDAQLSRKYYAEVLLNFAPVMFGSKAASMVVSVEKCVVFPLRANTIMRTRTMGALLAGVVITVYLLSAIAFVTYRVSSVYDETSGETFYVLVKTNYILRHPLMYDLLYDAILSFSLPIVNIVVVGVATAITVIHLRTAIAWRASTSSSKGDNHSQQQQVALTKMLVVLSCIFMASSVPLSALSIARLLVPDFSLYGRYPNFFFASHVVCVHFIAPVHSAVNFFVYYARSTRFRQDAMFGCREVKRVPEVSSRSMSNLGAVA